MKQLICILTLFTLSNLCLAGNIVGVIKDTEDGTSSVVSIPVEDGQEAPSQRQLQQAVMPKTEHRQLHPAEMLSYLTVCLYCQKPEGLRGGTGFFSSFPHPTNPNLHFPAIVSNRHVAKDAITTSFFLTIASNSLPTTEQILITVDDRTSQWINHPDDSIDLSILPLAPVLRQLEPTGKTAFIQTLNPSDIPDDDYMESITQTDEVIMIGYPGALRDEVNNQPIFRKGILATSPSKHFKGQREFLIDMPVYGGSSGSPVLLFSETGYIDRGITRGFNFAPRLKLLGINYGTYLSTVTGKLIPIPVPTVVVSNPESNGETTENEETDAHFTVGTAVNVPNNIGRVIHASCLKEMGDYIFNLIQHFPQSD